MKQTQTYWKFNSKEFGTSLVIISDSNNLIQYLISIPIRLLQHSSLTIPFNRHPKPRRSEKLIKFTQIIFTNAKVSRNQTKIAERELDWRACALSLRFSRRFVYEIDVILMEKTLLFLISSCFILVTKSKNLWVRNWWKNWLNFMCGFRVNCKFSFCFS